MPATFDPNPTAQTKATSPNRLSLPEAEAARGYPIEVTAAQVRGLQALRLPIGWRVTVMLFAEMVDWFPAQWAQTTAALLDRDGVRQDLFWWQQTIPDVHKGQVADILRLCQQSLVLTLHVPHGESLGCYDMGGLCILNDIIPGVKAQATVWYPRGLTTHAQRLQVSQAVLRWCLTDFGLQEVWAQTIHDRAVKHFLDCGAHIMAVVPHAAWYRGMRHHVVHLRLKADALPQEAHHGR